jgi:hypothetical protein
MALEKATALSEEPDPQVFYEHGLALFAFEKYKKALKMLKTSLKHDP